MGAVGATAPATPIRSSLLPRVLIGTRATVVKPHIAAYVPVAVVVYGYIGSLIMHIEELKVRGFLVSTSRWSVAQLGVSSQEQIMGLTTILRTGGPAEATVGGLPGRGVDVLSPKSVVSRTIIPLIYDGIMVLSVCSNIFGSVRATGRVGTMLEEAVPRSLTFEHLGVLGVGCSFFSGFYLVYLGAFQTASGSS